MYMLGQVIMECMTPGHNTTWSILLSSVLALPKLLTHFKLARRARQVSRLCMLELRLSISHQRPSGTQKLQQQLQ